MFCITFQAATTQCLAGLTGAIATRQLCTHLTPQTQPPTATEPVAKHAGDVDVVETATPLFFAGVQLNSHKHAPEATASIQRQQPTALVPFAGPTTHALAPGTQPNNQILPLVVHAALQSAQQPPAPAPPQPRPHAALARIRPAPTTLAPAQPLPLKRLQLKKDAPSALVVAEHIRSLQLRLRAVGAQLEACPRPSKDLQLRPQAGEMSLLLQASSGPLGAYEAPHKSLQLHLHPDPLPLEASRAPRTSLQLHVLAEALSPEALPQLQRALQLWQHDDHAPLDTRPLPLKPLQAVARPGSAAVVLAQPVARALAALPVQQAAVHGPAAPGGGRGAAALDAQQGPPPTVPLHHSAPLSLSVAAQPLLAAATAAAIPSRGGLCDGGGHHEGWHQGGSSSDSGWDWAGGGAGHGAAGEEGHADGQAPGGTVQFMLLLAAALAGVMGLHKWPQRPAPLQDAPLPAPAAPPASPAQWAEAEAEGEEGTHPLLKTMREALEHLEARQAALELEMACLKAIPRPSQDSIERKKEVEEELGSLAILQSALQQELRRLHA